MDYTPLCCTASDRYCVPCCRVCSLLFYEVVAQCVFSQLSRSRQAVQFWQHRTQHMLYTVNFVSTYTAAAVQTRPTTKPLETSAPSRSDAWDFSPSLTRPMFFFKAPTCLTCETAQHTAHTRHCCTPGSSGSFLKGGPWSDFVGGYHGFAPESHQSVRTHCTTPVRSNHPPRLTPATTTQCWLEER